MKEVVAKKTLNALEREQTKLDALLAKRAKIVKAYEEYEQKSARSKERKKK